MLEIKEFCCEFKIHSCSLVNLGMMSSTAFSGTSRTRFGITLFVLTHVSYRIMQNKIEAKLNNN